MKKKKRNFSWDFVLFSNVFICCYKNKNEGLEVRGCGTNGDLLVLQIVSELKLHFYRYNTVSVYSAVVFSVPVYIGLHSYSIDILYYYVLCLPIS